MKRLVWLVLLLGCPSPVRRPSSEQLSISGSVAWGGFERRADPLQGAKVTLWSASDPARSTAAQNGDYRVSAPASAISVVTLTAWADGAAPLARSLRGGPFTELQLSFALEPLERLECVDTGCADSLGGLQWAGAPSGANADGQLLDASRAPALPGSDTVLISAAVELDAGAPLSGTLILRVPRTSWANVVDVTPGTGAIEVATGTLTPDDRAWKPGPNATLNAEAGWPIPETQLESVRAGTFAPGVTASVVPINRGVVGIFGGPVRRGCVEGKVKLEDAFSPGITLLPLDGRPGASSSTGEVCFETIITTEPQLARVQYAGVAYAPVTVPTPLEPGTCGASSCRPLGTLPIPGDSVVSVAPCSLTVRVVDEVDQPLPQAVVIGNDDGLTQSTFASICGRMGTRCTLTGATDGMGLVKLVVPAQSAIEVAARVSTMTGARFGRLSLARCTKEVVTLRANLGKEVLPVATQFTGSTIDWVPASPAFRVVVERDGGVVWSLRSVTGVLPPLTYGVTPPTAQVETAASGVPATDDVVQLTFDSVTAGGIAVSGSSSARRE